MYPVSARFLSELRNEHHTIVAYSEFIYQGKVRATVPLLGGSITEDSTAAVRRRASLQFSGAQKELVIPAATWASTDPSPLWPVGWEVRVWSGLRFSDGTEEYVPCGVYRISKPRFSINGAGELQITVDGYDRSRQVSRARFTDLYWIAGGTDMGTAIKAVLQNRMPSLQDADFNFIPTDGSDGGPAFVTPWMVFVPQDDPWSQVQLMARSMGCELLFNGEGNPVLRYQPDPMFTVSVFDYVAGEANTMTEISRTLDDEQAYNGVVAIGKNNDNYALIPRAEAWDTDPTSPTFYDPARPGESVYGPVPYFYVSDYITTNAQAASAAQGLLVKVMGVLESVDFGAIGNPAHEANDVIRIEEPNTRVNENYLLEQYQFALGTGGLTSGTTRKRRAV